MGKRKILCNNINVSLIYLLVQLRNVQRSHGRTLWPVLAILSVGW